MTDASGYFRRTVSGFGMEPDDSLQVTVKPEFAIADWALAEPCECFILYKGTASNNECWCAPNSYLLPLF
jgi:hypothetical protein